MNTIRSRIDRKSRTNELATNGRASAIGNRRFRHLILPRESHCFGGVNQLIVAHPSAPRLRSPVAIEYWLFSFRRGEPSASFVCQSADDRFHEPNLLSPDIQFVILVYNFDAPICDLFGL